MQRIPTAVYVSVSNRIRTAREAGQERGLTTTEVAVLTFILVSIAVAIGILLYNYSSQKVTDLNDVNTNVIIDDDN